MKEPSPPSDSPSDNGNAVAIDLLLDQVEAGDAHATERLMDVVYDQLRRTAGRFFRAQPSDHTLQPTALVHEVYLRLIGNPGQRWQNRAHFCAVAAKAMRQILTDHARKRRASKRGGGRGAREPLTKLETPSPGDTTDLLALEEALEQLDEADSRGARVVELRYFGGLSNDEIAHVLGVSVATVERDWRRSSAWLRAQLEA